MSGHLREQWASLTKTSSATLWHVTDNPNFEIDPEFTPGSDMGAVYGKGLFLTTNPELWHYLWRPQSSAGVYAAEVRAPGAQRLGMSDDDRDQFFVGPRDIAEAEVVRVVPIEQAEAQANRAGYGFALIAADAIKPSRICVVDHRKGWGNPTALCGGVTDGNPIKWTTTAWVKRGPISDRICPECMEALR